MASGLRPPDGFIDLSAAYTSPDNAFVNIIGVVVDLMQPTKTTNGRDWTMSFRLLDRQLFGWVSGSEGLSIRFFRADPTHLPKVQNVGDVVLLRFLKMSTWMGQRSALSNYQTQCIVFPAGRIPEPSFAIAVQGRDKIQTLGIEREKENFNLVEQNYAISLKKDMAGTAADRLRKFKDQDQRREERQEQGPPAKKQKSNGTFNPKFKLIVDLEPRTYADLYGEVVKRIGVTYGCDLYITDYTSNPLLRQYDPPDKEAPEDRDGDIYGYTAGASKGNWKGPFGQLTMKINVKSPHAQVANKILNEGDYVLLQNVKTRVTDAGPWLEGDMWPDDISPEKVKVIKLEGSNNAVQLKALLERKAAYWKGQEARAAQGLREENNKAKKNGKKKNKKQKQETAGAQAEDESSTTARKPSTKPDKNPHIRCSHESVPLSNIRTILDPNNARHTNAPPTGDPYTMPFINVKYRAKVRVVDYEPKSLEDFAVPPLPEEQDESQDSMAWQYTGTPNFEWYFSLLLEDATNSKDHSRVWVHVQHKDAQFLFGNDIKNPMDLRAEPRLLAKLREKMFVLWGNLEEGGGEGLSNLPFECCIQEYGIEMDEEDPGKEKAPLGWQRMYSMFGVTIL
ncbi:hypothetical protein M409DRAFT_28336 [Zasmidium cellare ATCC 36951]|uniref:Protection of telomeres protein 1 n=1 Tax=Zasmidium cellare ATCC 36951 TaxID=1080233 RepID=A0A6A6C2E8_ZASCE|nr:uncharacterized protein M409DRAFT_28336 [Zasmidium cellare ATCC 36951]KAF2161297.1 hypothetical protein M409DRAFT_28336 [Zasmidium cellare ATCC 36951]